MKKQNNILASIKQSFGFIFITILLFSCLDEKVVNKLEVEEGIPVEINFNLSLPAMNQVVTRGLRDEEEFQINDLYLLIFDSNGNIKKGTKFYDINDSEINNLNGNNDNPTHGTISKIQTTSGKSYIFAAANVSTNQLDGEENLKKQLDKVSNINELKKITATLNSKTEAAQVDRTQASLVMSGAYKGTDNSSIDEEGLCIIPIKNSTLDGTIILERLDSHITFNISWGGKDSKVTSFELKEWKVYNVPVISYLFSQEEDAVKQDNKYYSESAADQKVTISDKSCSFDFYMLENRKYAQQYEGEEIKNYAQREEEIKESGKNTGEYKYVQKYATFVEIKANMELESNTTGGKKVAEVTYVIHLGGGNNDYTNFRSERNKKYTYIIQINDTEDIRVEVKDENERRPGVEGDVIDAQTKVYTLDAHYNCFIIGLTKKDARELSFMVKTPFSTVTHETLESERLYGDYKWIRFKRNSRNASGKLEKYPRYGEGLIDLFSLSSDIINQSGNDSKTFYYTVFIDEYYYTKPPTGQTWDTPYWKHFVNKENRYVMILFTPDYSKDGESSYADARYLITQRSIQTYYSSTSFNSTQSALGMEHINETGVPSTYSPEAPDGGWSKSNGYYNMYSYIKDTKWNDYTTMTTPAIDQYTFSMSEKNAWAACLSRNRDENNNGKIDPEEIKWYLPATNQLTGMFLGAESLTTPLFDADAYPEGTVSLNGDTRFHYMMSDNQKLWGEEGCSFGSRGYAGQPQTLRCVRNLNLDMNLDNAEEKNIIVGNVFTYNPTTHVFSLSIMDSKNIRGKVSSGELGLHDNFSISNRPYKGFQMAKEFHSAEAGKGTWLEFVNIGNAHLSKCSTYCEKVDESDKGKWRTPNQREFMIMYIQNPEYVYKNGYRAYSRTEWKYNGNRHFGYNDGILFLDQYNYKYDISLRCVRDVDIDSNGRIIE
ncbi:DUF4906 domain-containing protein [Oscillospiraceae bacterium N12]|jgi:hypothetical protein|uniref:DUF4906 domain-containing protein n=1 Tax=Jilunia laotingensis TaxID=2763675 RepID=A0A926F0U0_9BACT|nr:DUF4906 domain-containing protein [Jilunia laotingensis]MBC8591965.1 DUF4906 domain-containing protein [Jilunia laotingensis]